MISVGKDLESQFCMSQLFSVIFFFHFTVIKCYPSLLFEEKILLFPLHEALVEAYSLPFSIACSLCLIFALATS